MPSALTPAGRAAASRCSWPRPSGSEAGSQCPAGRGAVPGIAPHERAVSNGVSPHPVCGEHLIDNVKTGKVRRNRRAT